MGLEAAPEGNSGAILRSHPSLLFPRKGDRVSLSYQFPESIARSICSVGSARSASRTGISGAGGRIIA